MRAFVTALNCSAVPPLSGCVSSARLRYAFLKFSGDAFFDTPRTIRAAFSGDCDATAGGGVVGIDGLTNERVKVDGRLTGKRVAVTGRRAFRENIPNIDFHHGLETGFVVGLF